MGRRDFWGVVEQGCARRTRKAYRGVLSKGREAV
jgi:hypothetical protein